jgi:hypothetical protein
MGNVKVTPQGGGTPFEFNMLPDTGCTQSLVAEDVVSRYGLAVNWRGKKKIRAVNNQKLDCSGTVTLHLEFDGHSTEVVALVSSSIKSKVLLCWRTLQKLGVIPKDFPRARAAAVNASPVVVGAHTKGEFVETEQGVKDAVAQMMEEFGSVFCEEGQLQPMKTPGESFKTWWTRKKSKARDCDLDGVTRAQIMELELIRGVCDPKLRERLPAYDDPHSKRRRN